MNHSLTLPDDIPRSNRRKIRGGYGSFFSSFAIGERPTEVHLRTHTLIISPADWIDAVIGGHQTVLPRGSAIVAGYETIELTGPGDLLLITFGHEVVRKAIGNFPAIESLMLSASDRGICPSPIRGFYPGITSRLGPNIQTSAQLSEILRWLMFEKVSATAYSYFRRTFFLPRLLMRLKLEDEVLNPNHPEARFEREFQRLHGTTTQTWIERRRAELAMKWLRHGTQDAHDIANAFHCTDREFHELFKRHYGYSPHDVVRSRDCDRISPALLARIIRPPWAYGPPRYEPLNFSGAVDATDEIEASEIREAPEYQKIIPEAAVSCFWNLETTGLGNIVEVYDGGAERISLAA